MVCAPTPIPITQALMQADKSHISPERFYIQIENYTIIHHWNIIGNCPMQKDGLRFYPKNK
jgi:hypothetical protein